MEAICCNPYRVLGVLANSKASEITKNRNKIKAFLSADQEVKLDFDFPAFGCISRTEDSVNTAIAKLNLNQDKIASGLFWFYKGHHTDDPAFDCLKDGEIDNAIDIWGTVINSGELSDRNFSAYLNQSTLLLYKSVNNGTVDNHSFTTGIGFKLKALESDFIKDYCLKVADETFTPSKDEVQRIFIQEVEYSFVKSGKIKFSKLIEILKSFTFCGKALVFRNMTQRPIDELINLVEQTKLQRKKSPSTADKLGEKLFENAKEHLATLEILLGNKDIKFANISDKVADEVLQSGIEYFKKFKDSETVDPGSSSMSCLKLAKSIAVGSIVNQRCDENIANLQEWINDKPEREKQVKVKADLEALIAVIDKYESRSENISNAKLLVNESRPYLSKIKTILGVGDSFFLSISTRIAAQAQSYVITEVNAAQENVQMKIVIDRYGTIARIKAVLSSAWDVTNLIGTLDMEYNFKTNRFNPNRDTLKSLCGQLGVNTYSSTTSAASHGNSSTSTRSTSTYSPNRTSSYHQPVTIYPNAWWIGGVICAIIGGLIGIAATDRYMKVAGLMNGLMIGFGIGCAIGGIIRAANKR